MVVKVSDFSLEQTLESGQCFRYERRDDGYLLIAGSRPLFASQEGERLLLSCSESEYNRFWRDYFDLARDYAGLKRHLASCDETMARAVELGGGISASFGRTRGRHSAPSSSPSATTSPASRAS